jgi:hypothetical protein
MPAKVVKLDRRHGGYGHFAYRIELHEPFDSRIPKFVEWCHWCNETWGMGVQLNLHLSHAKFTRNQSWSYKLEDIKYDTPLIYLKTNQELELFTLKWL